ncbi:MAG: thioredoxin domain-containing protein, partial [Acidobacteriota bacterium]|nr:thioredoxin domain-containing protein [Acidobacteriota bacterium]
MFEGRYGVLPNGNAPFDPQQEFVNKNLLHTAQSIADLARASGKTPVDIAEVLLRARQVLFEVRNRRPRPQLDDKVLTAWNGLMIAAFARASRVLPQHLVDGDPGGRHLATAVRAATFIKDTMWDAAAGRLLRRYRGGDAAIAGYAEDYAYLIFGVLEVFQATGRAEWLDWARVLQARQDELFWDAEGGGWFSTTGLDPSVLL